jgi:hypothetical protein
MIFAHVNVIISSTQRYNQKAKTSSVKMNLFIKPETGNWRLEIVD